MALETTELAVIGAGPGGYAAAFQAADLGLDVTLVDPEPRPGGVCLYRGCIPSKALLHAAKLLEDARRARSLGIAFGDPEIDLARLRTWKQEVVEKLTVGLGKLAEARKVRTLRARARFEDARVLACRGVDGNDTRLRFEHAILATGSRPARLPDLPDDPRILDSSSALELDTLPERLLVVGGGYIGLELGSVYAALGSRVTLVEATESLLPGVDADLVRPLARRCQEGFESVRLETRVAAARPGGAGLRVSLAGGEGSEELDFDRMLVAVGRQPNSGDLGLEKTDVSLDADGFVEVDARRRSTDPAIRAIGDVAGEPLLAHVASHEGRVAALDAAGREAAFEPRAVPAVVFTDPEIAWCGLGEAEAASRGREIAVARFPWSASGRAATLDRADGLTKLVLEPETGRVLGVGIAGPGAGELIAEGVLAVEMGAVASDLSLCIHPHPTLSETLMEAAGVFLGEATHLHRPKG